MLTKKIRQKDRGRNEEWEIENVELKFGLTVNKQISKIPVSLSPGIFNFQFLNGDDGAA